MMNIDQYIYMTLIQDIYEYELRIEMIPAVSGAKVFSFSYTYLLSLL